MDRQNFTMQCLEINDLRAGATLILAALVAREKVLFMALSRLTADMNK